MCGWEGDTHSHHLRPNWDSFVFKIDGYQVYAVTHTHPYSSLAVVATEEAVSTRVLLTAYTGTLCYKATQNHHICNVSLWSVLKLHSSNSSR